MYDIGGQRSRVTRALRRAQHCCMPDSQEAERKQRGDAERKAERKVRTAANAPPVLLRESEVASLLGISISQVGVFRRGGHLHQVRVPGVRMVRYARAEVEALAQRWIQEAGIGGA